MNNYSLNMFELKKLFLWRNLYTFLKVGVDASLPKAKVKKKKVMKPH
jgi:hypothetical protein